MTEAKFDIRWVDRRREPQCAPNPAYPEGKDIAGAVPGEPACTTPLPYPARRIGYYRVECLRCGRILIVTTAGRPDDPRSVTVPCQGRKH